MLTVLVLLAATGVKAEGPASKAESVFGKLSWRSIGPAVMGGRTVDIEVGEKQPWVIFAAVGPSGVWRSMNNGITWENVFGRESTVSVGDLALDPADPNIIWAGTGEATCRNSVTIGDGVYKSADGGRTWTNMGLRETRHISRILVDRHHPQTVFVAAMGHLWGPNEERGVFKTTDGGLTWRRVLFVNSDTGAADLVQDPSDGNILYAAAYEHRRLPYRYVSGGRGSGLFKSTDGGETWRRLTKDLPGGVVGRIGIDVSRSQPHVVYALVEHAESGLWRSEDKGESWARVTDAKTFSMINTRPFYYSQVRVDPSDDKTVYVISTAGYVSADKGRSFRMFTAGTHSDHHALWIDPQNPRHLISGNDGGIDITYDGGKSWMAVQSIPAAEVYNIGYDFRDPYWIYCGLQDNHVWGAPSAVMETSGIQNSDWILLGGGDGFYVQPDPSDPLTVYANSQGNNIFRFDGRISRSKAIRPLAGPGEKDLRFNWNAPIHISPHDPKVVYTAGNRLSASRDLGRSWTFLSPDLTTNDPKKLKDTFGPLSRENTGAETHGTITTICESPVQAGVIWCGTDDGLVQVTLDGGQTWSNVREGIPGLPANTWCTRVEASPFEAGTVFASFDGHRTDDYGTYLFMTSDFGRTWTSIKGDLPFGWVHVVRADRRNRGLLFAGTEFGVFATLDRGGHWFSLRNNLPTVAVHDLAVHPRANDLIIGTHGWGLWILDDITPLQEADDGLWDRDMHLFGVRPCAQFILSSTRESYARPVFAGANPAYGLTLSAYFASAPRSKPVLSVIDAGGEEVYRTELPLKEGLHRVVWNLQSAPRTKKGQKPSIPGISAITLPLVSPGEFTVQLSLDGRTLTRPSRVNPDPRFDWPEEGRRAQREALAEVLEISRLAALTATAASSIRREIDELRRFLDKDPVAARKVRSGLSKFEKGFLPLKEEAIPADFGGGLTGAVLSLGTSIGGYPGPPTDMDLRRLESLREKVETLIDRVNLFIGKDIPSLNAVLEKNGLKPVTPPKTVSLSTK
ncbi:MAG: hypothetical protein A2Y56_08975 [Candidatus Aminicenantes bacterium RBG_13_63_10]|nr:MAG: hypothetical protein A2Y56_08975 [Candidatus Aminicenantes bacterium RBG_13_63_10]